MMAIDNNGEGQTPDTPPFPEITFPGSDLYTTWALGPGREDFFPSPDQQIWIPVLLHLTNISSVAFANGRTEENADDEGNELLVPGVEPEVWRSIVQVSRLFIRKNQGKPETLFLTALVQAEFFLWLENEANSNLRDAVKASVLGTPPAFDPIDKRLLGSSFAGSELEALDLPDLTGNPPSDGLVIVAIIDDGLPFGHERFWKAAGKTRIEYVWLQDSEFEVTGSSPAPFNYGRELTKSDIDGALADSTAGGMVDEDSFYRHPAVRAVKFDRDTPKSVAKRLSHGAHIMDAATGYDFRIPNEKALAEKRPVICVQLPTDSTAATSGKKLEPYLSDAIQYILARADFIADQLGTGPIPVVINFSYGHHLGAHDGTFRSEAFIEHEIAARSAPLRVVVPSGNSHLSRTHSRVTFANAGDAETLRWRVQPDGKAWAFMEIWLPAGLPAASRLSVEVIPPGFENVAPASQPKMVLAEIITPATPLSTIDYLPPDASTFEDLSAIIHYHIDSRSNRGVFVLLLPPTERLGPPDPIGPITSSGLWQVKLTAQDPPPAGDVHAWIFRDGPPLGFPIRGRQSYFDELGYRRYDDVSGRPIETDDPANTTQRAGSISGIATTDGEMIVVGGYIDKGKRPSLYSAGGPTNGTRAGPDAMAVSDDSMVHRGVLGAGTRSGSIAALDGTSVAAPQITRWIANHVTGNDLPNRAMVQAAATVALGTPERTGHGGVDRDDIGGLPIVELPRFYEP